MTTYDVIIVGSGIAGLYAALTIKKRNPRLSFLILEKHKKQWIGGRANNEPFYGAQIATGAGIGRKRDRLLKALVREHGFPINEFKVTPRYSTSMEPVDVKAILSYLRDEYQKYRGPPTTFEKFAKPILGDKTYKQFVLSSGYTDYEKAGAEETLYDYGMEDNACCLTGFSVDWHHLIHAMAANIGETHFRFSQNVTKITATQDNSGQFLKRSEAESVGIEGFSKRSGVETTKEFRRENDTSQLYLLETEYGKTIYKCRKVIVATTITGLRELFPRHPIYREIEGQPFLRIYGKFTKSSIPTLKEYVGGHIVVTGPLQKMIAINPDTGVYMIVYNDNRHTLALKSRTENTEDNREYYCDLIERSLGIPENKRIHLIAIRSFYWNVGTHYYKPLNTAKYSCRDEFIDAAQHPTLGRIERPDDILVVGEVVTKHQGWVEGALESVDLVVTKKWINNI
jgi:hypothetical protein